MSARDEVKAKLAAGKAVIGAAFSKDEIKQAAKSQAHPDPLADVDYTGDLEADAKAEMNALGQGLSGRSKEWAEKFARMNDTEFWLALCFKDRAAKDAFIRAIPGLLELGDKYVDGHKLAKLMGVEFDGR